MSVWSIWFIESFDLIVRALKDIDRPFLADDKSPNLLVVALELLPCRALSTHISEDFLLFMTHQRSTDLLSSDFDKLLFVATLIFGLFG